MNEQKQAKPAPGPWLNWTNEIVDANHIEVCEIYARAEDEGMRRSWTANANARLIAAAPDLLEALQALLGEIDDCSQPDHWEGYEAAKEAIAKAKGEQ